MKTLEELLFDYTRGDKTLEETNQALKELGISSPLAELGFSKREVRELARGLGLSAASRPSTPCLATRLPYGARLEPELLRLQILLLRLPDMLYHLR